MISKNDEHSKMLDMVLAKLIHLTDLECVVLIPESMAIYWNMV